MAAWGCTGALLCAAHVGAQETNNGTAPAATPPVIGPPQLKDFQLEPRERIVTQPAPSEPAQQPPAEQPPAQRQPAPPTPAGTGPTPRPRSETAPTPAPSPVRSAPAAPSGEAPATLQDLLTQPGQPPAPAAQAPAPSTAPVPPPTAELQPAPVSEQGTPWWPFALGALLMIGAGAFLLQRRRAAAVAADVPAYVPPMPDEDVAPTPPLSRLQAAPAAPVAKPAPPAAPTVQVKRPWIELEVTADRLSFTDKESVVQFELIIRNAGDAPARELRVDVKLINACREQDQEIGAFFETAGRETTKLRLPGLPPGAEGQIKGEVAMPVDEMRALKMDNRMLFIPVIAVNALYDWGEGQTGQSSKSYIIGRELPQPSEKMGPFHLEKGPRIWRSVGQRPHNLERRV